MFILRAAEYVRQAHNLKVAGSNPAAPTILIKPINTFLTSKTKQRLNEVKFIHNPSPNPNRFLQGVARLFFYVSLVCFFSNL